MYQEHKKLHTAASNCVILDSITDTTAVDFSGSRQPQHLFHVPHFLSENMAL